MDDFFELFICNCSLSCCCCIGDGGNIYDGHLLESIYYQAEARITQWNMNFLTRKIPNSDNTMKLVGDMADVMVRSGYLAELRYPYEVFHLINRLLPIPVNPYFLDAAMLEYTIKEGGKHLKMVNQKDGSFRYEEC